MITMIWLCGGMTTFGSSHLSDRGKPNVILIITDDQGYGDLSVHGNPWLKTPHLDQLYHESTRLTNFHVSPTCAPTRAALLTGHYANRTGVWHTVGGRSLLRESEVTMADVLTDNGYATGIFGKWHLGDNYPFRPQDRGFQEVLVHGGGGVGQGPDYWNNNYFDDTYFHNGKPEKVTGYCTDVWFEHAVRFIDQKREKDQPFFCYLSTNAPHSPYYVDSQYVAPYISNHAIPNPAFYGMIANVDENVGRLMDYLRRNRLEENTLLVYMTDNGSSAGAELNPQTGMAEQGFNAGMRGKKGSMYEGGHRVPCFVRWPAGNIPAGQNVDDLTAHIDLLPTLVDLLKLKFPDGLSFDGISLKPVLSGQADGLPIRTLITDSQRLEKPQKWRQSSIMRGPWRLINGEELYHLDQDLVQQRDVARQHPSVVQQLRADYERWWNDISPGFAETPAIRIGTAHEPTTLLRVHDMHMEEGAALVPWNQEQIRQGTKSQGWYAISVTDPGTYEITLMRWPPEAEANLTAALPTHPALPGTTVGPMVVGQSLDLKEAGVAIGDIERRQPVRATSGRGVSFAVPLTEGEHQLSAWFINQAEEAFAAYYVKIEKE